MKIIFQKMKILDIIRMNILTIKVMMNKKKKI